MSLRTKFPNNNNSSISPTNSQSNSPTLTELNTTKHPSLHIPPLIPVDHYPTTDTINSSTSIRGHSPYNSSGGKEGSFDDLSASFRSLYRSLFDSVGHSSIPSYPMLSSSSSLTHPHQPPLSTSISTTTRSELTSISHHYKPSPDPHLTLVMDSLRDLADSNQWDRLSSAQIQTLKETVNEGDHIQFGMDHDSFLKWSDSFNQFLSQLNSQVPISSHPTTDLRPSMGELNHTPYSTHSQMSLHVAPPTSLPPPYMPSLHHIKSSVGGMTPPPPLAPPPPLLYGHPGGHGGIKITHSQDPPPFSSVATDLFQDDGEEEEDFDWSKLV